MAAHVMSAFDPLGGGLFDPLGGRDEEELLAFLLTPDMRETAPAATPGTDFCAADVLAACEAALLGGALEEGAASASENTGSTGGGADSVGTAPPPRAQPRNGLRRVLDVASCGSNCSRCVPDACDRARGAPPAAPQPSPA